MDFKKHHNLNYLLADKIRLELGYQALGLLTVYHEDKKGMTLEFVMERLKEAYEKEVKKHENMSNLRER